MTTDDHAGTGVTGACTTHIGVGPGPAVVPDHVPSTKESA